MRERIGRFEVRGRLGVGSFATVHRALDLRLDDEVAVKVLAENHSANPEMLSRFIGEGRALRRAGGPHVAAVHDIGELPHNQPYLVLELADRGTLGDRVEQLRATGWTADRRDLLLVARSLTAALGSVHRADLVHRDLSPWNLLLTARPDARGVPGAVPGGGTLIAEDERLLLADLGMCKDLARSSGMTVAAGTSGFRPPEQERHGVVDRRADIWAMSALMEWLADGARMPSAFTRALARGRAENPRKRPEDVETWLASIEEALADPPAAAPDSPAPELAPAPRSTLRRRVLPAVALLIIGLLVGLGLGKPVWDDAPVAASDGASLAIDGPETLAEGESATYSADVTGVDSWVWTLPDGRHVVGERTVSLTPTSPGRADVVLRARAADGTELESRLELRVEQ
ncbi:protein kinase domain-containing protein [Brachybacterium tyrofermentans]|uniref:protein kinase domain-containing protein n=1 Tax=Brachybacterium tyrofermentans TaxID=47848 RepID=UPI003FD6AEE6